MTREVDTSPASDDSSLGDREPPYQLRLTHLIYIIALFGSSLSAFGAFGVPAFLIVSLFWGSSYLSSDPPKALKRAGCVCAWVIMMTLLYLSLISFPSVGSRRPSPLVAQCNNNLRQITLAVLCYQDRHGIFPPAYIPDENGRPKHSWRVLILPYLDDGVYRRYRFDEPWNGPNNRQLLADMPDCYQCPYSARSGSRKDGCTNYFAVVGPDTAWPAPKSRTLAEMTDGTSNTLLLVEEVNKRVPWLAPVDLAMDAEIELLSKYRSRPPDTNRAGHTIAFADGHVELVHYGRVPTPETRIWSIDNVLSALVFFVLVVLPYGGDRILLPAKGSPRFSSLDGPRRRRAGEDIRLE